MTHCLQKIMPWYSNHFLEHSCQAGTGSELQGKLSFIKNKYIYIYKTPLMYFAQFCFILTCHRLSLTLESFILTKCHDELASPYHCLWSWSEVITMLIPQRGKCMLMPKKHTLNKSHEDEMVLEEWHVIVGSATLPTKWKRRWAVSTTHPYGHLKTIKST